MFENTNFDLPKLWNLTFILEKHRQQLYSPNKLTLTWITLTPWPPKWLQLASSPQLHFSTAASISLLVSEEKQPAPGCLGPHAWQVRTKLSFCLSSSSMKVAGYNMLTSDLREIKNRIFSVKGIWGQNKHKKVYSSKLVFLLQGPEALPHSNWHTLKLNVFAGLYNCINYDFILKWVHFWWKIHEWIK